MASKWAGVESEICEMGPEISIQFGADFFAPFWTSLHHFGCLTFLKYLETGFPNSTAILPSFASP